MKKLTVLLILLSLLLCPVRVFANSAPKYWEGSGGTGVYALEDCPVEVTHERLVFDISSFPSSPLSSYDASVTANYTFHNTGGEAIDVRLVFPFGLLPSYAGKADPEELVGSGRYEVRENGSKTDTVLRATYYGRHQTFDLSKDLSQLRDTYREDDFYHPDTPVYEYHFLANVEKMQGPNAEARAEWSFTPGSFTVTGSFNSISHDKGVSAVGVFVTYDEEFTVYLIGNKADIVWQFTEEEAEGAIELREVKETTLLDYALSRKDIPSLSDTDWYNALVDEYIETDNRGIVSDYDLSNNLMFWLEYSLHFDKNGTLENSVKAPLWPYIDGHYEDPIHTYTYLLSPASAWKDFGDLDIEINTPYYLLKNEPGTAEKTESGYRLHFDSLPEKELSFDLCASEDPKPAHSDTYVNIFLIFMGVALLLFILLLVIIIRIIKRIRRKRRMKSRERA